MQLIETFDLRPDCSLTAQLYKAKQAPGTTTMREFFDRLRHWAKTTPDAIAVAEAPRELTYQALDQTTDALAHELWAARDTDNDVVAFCGEISLERFIAAIATLKAGMAFVCLDPGNPVPALRELIEHSGSRHILATAPCLELAEQLSSIAPILIAAEEYASGDKPFDLYLEAPEKLATVRYTSGSTGRPKGVPLSRSKLDLRLNVKYQFHAPAAPPIDRRIVSIFNPFADTTDLMGFGSGDQVECFDYRRHGPTALAEWLQTREISCLACFISLFRQLCAASNDVFPHIQEVAVVGEPPTSADLEAFEARTRPGAIFTNRFGASEHGDMTRFTHRHGAPIEFDLLPLGPPLKPEWIRLEDEDGRDVQVGEPGQLIITAPFIPNAYLDDPERSAAVFKPDARGSGQISCYTGFMAFQDYRGWLHPIGRKDEQVKIRGYNVLPTDVEQHACQHPDVAEAAVIAFDDRRGVRRLACYYITEAGVDLPPRELRRFIADRAAAFLTPSVLYAVDHFPRTTNGKLLRRGLPDPLADLSANLSDAPPREASKTEALVISIWKDILSHERFGLDDDFFDVGGDSLQAMSVLMAIEQATGLRLPMESLILDGAAVRQISARLDAIRQGGASDRPILMKSGSTARPIFTLPVAGGHLSNYLTLVHCLDKRRPVYGIHPRGMDGRTAPDATMAALARNAAEVIQRQDSDGPHLLLGYSFATTIAFETARRLQDNGAEVAGLILLDPIAPWLDLLRDVRAVYHPLKKGDVIGAFKRARAQAIALLDEETGSSQLDEAHSFALRRYQPTPLTIDRVLIVTAAANPHATTTLAAWRNLLRSTITERQNPGEHHTMLRAPHVWPLSQTIEAWLNGSIGPEANNPTHEHEGAAPRARRGE